MIVFKVLFSIKRALAPSGGHCCFEILHKLGPIFLDTGHIKTNMSRDQN